MSRGAKVPIPERDYRYTCGCQMVFIEQDGGLYTFKSKCREHSRGIDYKHNRAVYSDPYGGDESCPTMGCEHGWGHDGDCNPEEEEDDG